MRSLLLEPRHACMADSYKFAYASEYYGQ